jgi:dTDP-4-dehydrorhamnose reductase
VDDEWGNPTWAPSLADAIVALFSAPLSRDATVWHLAGEPPTSRLGWAKRVLSNFDVEILPIKLADYPRPSQPPRRAILDCRRARLMGLALEWMSRADGSASLNRMAKIPPA